MPETQSMSAARFEEHVLASLDAILQSCEERHRPIQEEPSRGDLFDLFAAAAQRELVDGPLSSDAICRQLASRWGLAGAVRSSVDQRTGIPPDQMARMRSLWGLIQMWMEWTYAWERWSDFHNSASPADFTPNPADSGNNQ